MRGKSMVLIVIALGCGLVASIGISQILDRQKNTAAPKVETRKIYVAVRDVDIDEVFDVDMIKLEEWPVEKTPEGAITKLDEIKGLTPNQRMYAGEPVRKEKLVDPHKRGGESIRIPKGYRVQAIKVTSDAVAGGLIQPGDHVDVHVYLRQSGSITQTTTRTILQDVRVFAVNAQTTKEVDEQGKSISAKTVSLLATPQQVQTLLLASRLGQISLSLRRPDDDTADELTGGTSVRDLLAGPSDGTPDENDVLSAAERAQAANAASDFAKWLGDVTSSDDSALSAPSTQVANSGWRMEVWQLDGNIATYEVENSHRISVPRLMESVPGASVSLGANAPIVTGPGQPSATGGPATAAEEDAAGPSFGPESDESDGGDDGAGSREGDDSASGW
ncbi:MAG: Flp pilus assembly protein CpaB [Planctomycetales bacterium]|nr:Flp pilus assembly protein CpaB [Planctomycetales bacterium]